MARETSHEVPKPAVRKLVIDVVELSISVEIPTVQQEVNPVIDVGWKEIFKSIEDKAEGEEKQKQTKGYRNLRELLQIWLVATTKKRNQCMLLR